MSVQNRKMIVQIVNSEIIIFTNDWWIDFRWWSTRSIWEDTSHERTTGKKHKCKVEYDGTHSSYCIKHKNQKGEDMLVKYLYHNMGNGFAARMTAHPCHVTIDVFLDFIYMSLVLTQNAGWSYLRICDIFKNTTDFFHHTFWIPELHDMYSIIEITSDILKVSVASRHSQEKDDCIPQVSRWRQMVGAIGRLQGNSSRSGENRFPSQKWIAAAYAGAMNFNG